MRYSTLVCLFFYSSLVFCQQEASVWYFGQNAGLKFQANGAVVPLADGQLNTEEGCSSIADANGNLLFYTDGRTVWDRNHVVMPNGNYSGGTGLFGDPSSTQSAIIVPKPNDPNIYFIFTVDEPHHENAAVYPNAFSGPYVTIGDGATPLDDDGLNHGLNYSVLDLSVTGSNGSIGDIVSRNNHLITYNTLAAGEEIKYKCSEKITAVKNENTNEYWIVTHFIDKFHAFKVTATGVVATPITSQIGPSISLMGYRRNAQGYLKVSPLGDKIAIVHAQNGSVSGQASYQMGSVLLYDFNKNTGTVSNENTIVNNVQPYGVEFSPQGKKLYTTYRDGIVAYMTLSQFDLESSNITTSEIVLENNSNYMFALQLAPNNKIYCATGYQESLGVINNPELNGSFCNYVANGQPLIAGRKVNLGLPPFITSFFNASFTAVHLCLGDTTQFSFIANQTIVSIHWDFGDGFTSGAINPTHQFASAGTYSVIMTLVTSAGTVSKNRQITISAAPAVANPVANQSLCGTVNMTYNLSQFDATLLGAQPTATYGVAYFLSAANAVAHTGVLAVNYNLPLGTTTIHAKVYNLSNINCYALSSFTVSLSQQPVANPANALFMCDDASNDGLGNFALQNNSSIILGTQSSTTFTVTYHLSQADANSGLNTLPGTYQNVSNPQDIYARITNNSSSNCFATTTFRIGLYKMPVANQPFDLYACDAGNDLTEPFTLSSQTPIILGASQLTGYTVSYHSSQAEANSGSNPLAAILSVVGSQTVYVRVENQLSAGCYATTFFNCHVKALPVIALDNSYTICEGQPITLTAAGGFASYDWSTGATSPSIIVSQAGSYTLTVTKNYGGIVCSNSKTTTVTTSSVAKSIVLETEDWTEYDNSINVVVSPVGNYEYSIDNIHFQDSNTFYGLPVGLYTVYVKNNCGMVNEQVALLHYPKFFTPNSDGINDYWNVKYASIEPTMDIAIFDRYGKLVKQMKGSGFGWDGTHNGTPLLSDDYWFVVQRKNGREYKGHFTLKR